MFIKKKKKSQNRYANQATCILNNCSHNILRAALKDYKLYNGNNSVKISKEKYPTTKLLIAVYTLSYLKRFRHSMKDAKLQVFRNEYKVNSGNLKTRKKLIF